MTAPLEDPQPVPYQELLEQQSCVVARWQALAGGLSKAAWEWRIQRELWQIVLPGIAVAHSGTVTFAASASGRALRRRRRRPVR
jgi:hypothetical protein